MIKLLPQSCANGIVIDEEKPTANCAVIFDKPGDCKLVLGDMRIHSSITTATVSLVLIFLQTQKNYPDYKYFYFFCLRYKNMMNYLKSHQSLYLIVIHH